MSSLRQKSINHPISTQHQLSPGVCWCWTQGICSTIKAPAFPPASLPVTTNICTAFRDERLSIFQCEPQICCKTPCAAPAFAVHQQNTRFLLYIPSSVAMLHPCLARGSASSQTHPMQHRHFNTSSAAAKLMLKGFNSI